MIKYTPIVMRKAFLIYNKYITAVFISYVIINNLLIGRVLSQEQRLDLVKVTDIEITGQKAVSTQTIMAQIKTKEGMEYNQSVLSEDIKRLYGTGYFSDIDVKTEDYNNGKKVIFTIKEKPILKEIVIEGNKAVEEKQIRSQMQSVSMDFLAPQQIKDDVAAIKKVYIRQGYSQVKIDSRIDLNEQTNEAVCVITIDEGKRVRIEKIYVHGNYAFKTKKILKWMSTRRDTLFTSGFFKEETFEQDLEKLNYFYKENGYLDVKIEHSFEFDKKHMYITLNIVEGRQYFTGEMSVKGNTIYPEKELLAKLNLKTGNVFNETVARQQAYLIQEYYFERGYIEARVGFDPIFNPLTEKLDVVFRVTEGGIFYINRVDIKGNTKTRDIVIRRELRAFPGERFDGTKIQRSRERLYNLGFFEEVNFDTQASDKPDKKDLVVDVKESKTGEFSFGAGYSSLDRFIGFLQVSQKNFDWRNFPTFTGDGQQLSLRTEFGSRKRDYELSFTEPWIFNRPISFGFDLYNRTRQRRDYDETRTGGDLRLGKALGEYNRIDGVYKLEQVRISDVAADAMSDIKAEEGNNNISSTAVTLTRDTRDNVFNPSRGLLSRGSLEIAGGPFAGDKDFMKYDFLSSWYYEWLRKSVLEFKIRGGYVDNFGDTERVPIYERFFAGGATTIRGYEDQYVGPLQNGDPVGGKTMFIGNVEYTMPLVKNLKAALFYDTGYVWEKPADTSLSDLKSSIGAGIRIKTPIGPVKLDYGYGLNYDTTDKNKNGRIHFSMSHGF